MIQMAREHNLRADDAVHLAAASAWQGSLDLPVDPVSFDWAIGEPARAVGRMGLTSEQ
jgi:hypothetical protein